MQRTASDSIVLRVEFTYSTVEFPGALKDSTLSPETHPKNNIDINSIFMLWLIWM